MAMNHQLNRVLSNAGLAVATPDLTVANAVNYTTGGILNGPTVAATTVSLAGVNLAANKQGIVNVYVKNVGGVHTFEAKLGSVETIPTDPGVLATFDLNDVNTYPLNGYAFYDATLTYNAGAFFTYDFTVYQVKVGQTILPGALDFSKTDLINYLSIGMSERALVAKVLVRNGDAVPFVGGTTAIAGLVTTVLIDETYIPNI